jgi:hypothetical protein
MLRYQVKTQKLPGMPIQHDTEKRNIMCCETGSTEQHQHHHHQHHHHQHEVDFSDTLRSEKESP